MSSLHTEIHPNCVITIDEVIAEDDDISVPRRVEREVERELVPTHRRMQITYPILEKN